jgi:hypothetical protein
LLADEEGRGLACVEQNISSFSAIISKANEPDIEFVAGRLSDLAQKADDAAKARISLLSEQLGLADRLPDKEPEVGDSVLKDDNGPTG